MRVKNFFWSFIRKMANFNLAIFILFFIMILIMLGSIIEQGQTINYYQEKYPIYNSHFSIINWKLIFLFGLDHLYQNLWFILILFLFVLSLISCSFFVQLPTLKNARRWKYFANTNINSCVSSNYINLSNYYLNPWINIIYALNKRNFYIFQKSYYIYAYKGLLGRIAPIFVHISIIITLFGSMLGLLYGYTFQEMSPCGEFFHLKNIIDAGLFSNIHNNYMGFVDDFYIQYNSDGSIKQFFSSIFVLDKKVEILKKYVISVNSPLRFKGFTFYQTDWQFNGLRIQVGSDVIVQKPIYKIGINNKLCYICILKFFSHKPSLFIITNFSDGIFLYDYEKDLIEAINIDQSIYIKNILFKIQNYIISTGLQIKVDQGLVIVYSGFFIMILSTFLSYISYSQIWLTVSEMGLIMNGSSNRAVLFFEKDVVKIHKLYKKYTLKRIF